jgi:lipoprotein NlpD
MFRYSGSLHIAGHRLRARVRSPIIDPIIRARFEPVRCLLLALTLALLVACGSSPPQRATTYTVKRGDTLYSIAWRHGLNYRDIARWNGIGPDYVIYPGQKLRLYPSGKNASVASTAKPASKPSTTTTQPARPRSTPPPVPASQAVRWHWPVSGGTATLTSRPNGGYGLTVGGRLGDEVRAAADGSVVYTGSGLLGYGQLVIIKHNDTYLSAYGHTQAVAVKEGDRVKAGQRVATMGAGPQGTPQLYFEIRVNGTPRNPLELLPARK